MPKFKHYQPKHDDRRRLQLSSPVRIFEYAIRYIVDTRLDLSIPVNFTHLC